MYNKNLLKEIEKNVLLNRLEDLTIKYIDTRYRWFLGNNYNMMLDDKGREINFEEFKSIYDQYIEIGKDCGWFDEEDV